MYFNEIVLAAAEAGASDVHICVGACPKFRIHGELEDTDFPAVTAASSLEMLISLMSPEQREKFEEHGELDLSASIEETGRCRVNAYKQKGGITMAVRLMDREVPKAADLGVPQKVLEALDCRRGLVMVTGLAGCGKSTVLSSLVDYINETRALNIITLEDPIEYLHVHKRSIVNQREIGLDAPNYVSALKSAMRQDPDVLQVSRIVTAKEASLVLTSVEMGRLLLTASYAECASEAIRSFVCLFPENEREEARIRLSNVISVVLSRKLLHVEGYGESQETQSGEECHAHKVLPVCELFIANSQGREAIRNGRFSDLDSIIENGRSEGMFSM
ncbi:MAG: Flp pilus assembly complex ATPase component TadA, partial [Lachnospiraceae bacterium]|nr:Flp pilus assembly complex ATPase component TadA [Lachnospiraceae bacterium]